jgi:hypothetical protein
MAWSVLQSKGGSATNIATLTVTYPNALTSGTKMIALAATDGNSASISNIHDSANTNFTSIITANNGGSITFGQGGLFALDNPGGITGAITASLSAGCDPSLVIQEVQGLATGNTVAAMIDGTAASLTGSASGSVGPPSYTDTAANEYLVFCFTDFGSGSTVGNPGSPYTTDANSENGPGVAACIISYKNSAGTTETGHYTAPASDDWAMFMAAFKISGGGGGPIIPQVIKSWQPIHRASYW